MFNFKVPMNRIHVKLVILVILVILVTLFTILVLLRETNAQGLKLALNFDNENVSDIPKAPINMLVYAGLVVGSFFGIRKIKF